MTGKAVLTALKILNVNPKSIRTFAFHQFHVGDKNMISLSGSNACSASFAMSPLPYRSFETAKARVEPLSLNNIGVGEFGSVSSCPAAMIAMPDINKHTVRAQENRPVPLLTICFPPVRRTTS